MAETERSGTDPKVPAERADLKTAEGAGRDGAKRGPDRPGFDLSGGADDPKEGGSLSETGPRSDPTLGNDHPAGGSQLTSDKGTPA